MVLLANRIIEYLLADAPLVALLSDSESIFIDFGSDRKSKYITVSSNLGEDGNNIPSQSGSIFITAIVNREEANAELKCINIAEAIDDLLNKKENLLTDLTYKVIHFVREDSTGLQADDMDYFYRLEYAFILDEST